MLKKLFPLSMLLLSACTVIDTYNPNALPSNQLAKVTVVNESSFFKSDITADIRKVSINDEVAAKPRMYSPELTEVFLDSGQYEFFIRCDRGNYYNYHFVSLEIESGQEYNVYCLAKIKKTFLSKKAELMAAYIDNADEFEVNIVENQKLIDSMSKP